MHLLTDSRSLFDVISTVFSTSEKRMILDIAAAREGFRYKLIPDIGLVRSSENAADGLTKCMHQRTLQKILMDGSLCINPGERLLGTRPSQSN